MASIHIEPNMEVHRAAMTIQSAWRSWVAPGLPTVTTTLAEWHEDQEYEIGTVHWEVNTENTEQEWTYLGNGLWTTEACTETLQSVLTKMRIILSSPKWSMQDARNWVRNLGNVAPEALMTQLATFCTALEPKIRFRHQRVFFMKCERLPLELCNTVMSFLAPTEEMNRRLLSAARYSVREEATFRDMGGLWDMPIDELNEEVIKDALPLLAYEQPDWKYYNPIIDVVSYLTDKVGPDITREIAMFSSESVDRNEAAKAIQWWWLRRGLQWDDDNDDDDDEEWRYRCVGPYSDDLSRCFGLCCN